MKSKIKRLKLQHQRKKFFFFDKNNKNQVNNIKNKKKKQGKVFEQVRKNSKWCYKQKMKHGDVKHKKLEVECFSTLMTCVTLHQNLFIFE